jgi:hypothetical protein
VIPVIFASGNHDLGKSAYAKGEIIHNEYQPVFKHYFPQHAHNYSIPKIRERKSYFSHKFGDTLLLLSLDTGHQSLIEGEQTNWLQEQFNSNNYAFKIAQYHVPIYPACYPHRDQIVQELGKKYWVDLFDRYELTAAIENHNHGFKRSKRLKDSQPDPNGTVYLGEGAWGAIRTH